MIQTLKEYEASVNSLNIYTCFYNDGNPLVSDKEWDDLYFQIKEYEERTGVHSPYSPTHAIVYQKVDELEEVSHNHPMLSLDKTKDWDEFLKYFSSKDASKNVVGMVKLDGLTCSLHYVDGQLVSAETRGNGTVGSNILHNALVINSIPKKIEYKDELILDGEVICKRSDFEPFADEYKNPRNFAAGSIRLLDSSECAHRNLTFVVWNVVKGFSESNSFIEKLELIEKQGFITVPWTSSFDWDAADFLKNQADELGYPIDGLVGRFDDIAFGESLPATAHHNGAAFAFKFYDEEYETQLLDIEYGMGRTGQLTPVAVFQPVATEDSIIERASLHNLSVLKEILGQPYVGQKIKVAKMNMIIPQVMSAADWIEGATAINPPDICPVCGGKAEVVESDSGIKNLICANPQCSGKAINVIDHFVGLKGLDIKGLSKATIEKLIDWEWVASPIDIFYLDSHAKEWVKKPGFGPKSVEKVLEAIKKGSEDVDLWRIISAAGIPLIGSTVAKQLAEEFKTYEAFREAIDNKYDFTKLYGFGYNMADSLLNYNYDELDEIAKIVNIKEVEDTEKGNSLQGINFCITGKLTKYKNRDALKAEIENNGGKVLSSISKNTNYLINNDVNSSSSKNASAKKMGIPIISEEEFIEKFL
jgi:DNA ligase (NAD+)